MSTIEDLERVLVDYPKVHRGEPEIREPAGLSEAILKRHKRERLLLKEHVVCYGINAVFARELFLRLKPGMKTLETGSGISTIVFALVGTSHTAVTPETGEADGLKQYAQTAGIDLSLTTFAVAPSEQFLPTFKSSDLDLVLIDGKHAFPWPAIDWFYTADCLKTGGLMILDDTHLNSVRLVTDFMDVDPHWQFEASPGGRTSIYRKLGGPVHDLAWYMQPWMRESKPPLHERALMQTRRFAGRILRATPLRRLRPPR
jgi:hypothetical protein